jgi:hypothetical protein
MNQQGRGPVAGSLLAAAHELEQARSGADVRVAVRDGLLGLEYHLDTLARELAQDPGKPGAIEPGLRPRAERVEAKLRNILLDAWAMLVLTDEQLGALEPARALARSLRAADHQEIALVFDALLSPQALD